MADSQEKTVNKSGEDLSVKKAQISPTDETREMIEDFIDFFQAKNLEVISRAMDKNADSEFQNSMAQVVLTQSVVLRPNFSGGHTVDWVETGKHFKDNLVKFWSGYSYEPPKEDAENLDHGG